MPGESVKRGGACEIVPLAKVGPGLIKASSTIDKCA